MEMPELRSPSVVEVDPQPGDVYYTSWGYDQTNVEFFQVVKRTPGTVTVRRIGAYAEGNKLWPEPGKWGRDVHIDGNDGTPSRLRAEQAGYSEKLCRLHSQKAGSYYEGKPGQSLTIDDVRRAWPYEGRGQYETFAAGGMGH
jgi:hypothetical protein